MAKRRDGSQIDNLTPDHQKLGIALNSLMCRWRATYRWKAFDKGYNFGSNITSIGGL